MLAYRIELTPDDNGTLLVTCPALQEVTTFADDADEAQVVASEAIEEALAGRIARGEDIPASEGDGVSLPLLTELKTGLYRACRQQGVIRAELARRLDWYRESVDRLFRLDHASRLEQLEAAFHAVGVAVSVSFVGAGKGDRPHA
jgi:antitoxin HicB